MKLKIKKLRPTAKLPTQGSDEAACFDLYVSEDTILPPREGVLVPTGLAFEVPEGYSMKIYLRSSMCRRGIVSSVGVVDEDFRGEVKVQAFNVGNTLPVVIYAGERIGQAEIVPVQKIEFELADELSETASPTRQMILRGATGLLSF